MEPGTKLVCIENDGMIFDLTVGKTYTLLEGGRLKEAQDDFYILMGDKNPGVFHTSRFISIRKFRKLKLEKLYESNLH